MNSISQLMKYRRSMVEYALKHGVTKTAIKYNTYRQEDLTLFERKLKDLGIKHKKIRPFTPRHNGKVERSHRKDNERFYATHCFFSFEDFRRQLKRYNYRDYNCFPMRPLGWKSPKDTLHDFIKHGVTYV